MTVTAVDDVLAIKIEREKLDDSLHASLGAARGAIADLCKKWRFFLATQKELKASDAEGNQRDTLLKL